MSIRRAHLVANTKSGKGKGADVPELAQKICDELGIQLIVYSSAKNKNEFEADIGRAVAGAIEDKGVVIAAGGDGTIRSVAQMAADKGADFGVIAVGTFNFFARNHGLPEDPEHALRVALTGKPKPVRLGEMNGHVFLINASVGLYAKSIVEREQHAKTWGRNRFVATVSTLVSLFKKQKLMSAEFETEKGYMKIDTPMIFIGNNDLQLERFSFKVAEALKENKLAVILFKPLTRSGMLRVVWRTFLGTGEKEPEVYSFSVRHLKITTTRQSHDVALDGEMFHMQSPLEVQVLPKALNLILPANKGALS